MNYKQTIGRLIGITHHLFQKKLGERLSAANVPITAEQFKMMSRLWEKDGISQQEIAKKVSRNRAATGRMIDTLEKYGLVERKSHPTDRRLKLVFLTKKGNDIKEVADQCAQETLDIGMSDLSDNEQKKLKKMLKSIIVSLS